MVLSTSLAQQRCFDLFSKKNEAAIVSIDPLDSLTNLEQEIKTISDVYYRKFSNNQRMIENLGKINNLFEETFMMLEATNTQSKALKFKIEFLAHKVDEFKNTLFILEQRQTNTRLAKAMENPKILLAERLYELNGMDPMIQKVSFSKEVLEDIFWNEQPLMQRASGLIFRGLHRGRQFATDKSGIISFDNDRSVFKVKISGDTVGAIRVAGFIHGRDFHVVAWSNESSHDVNSTPRLTDKVNRIKEHFLKTGSY